LDAILNPFVLCESGQGKAITVALENAAAVAAAVFRI
jgi:hypothetical protein